MTRVPNLIPCKFLLPSVVLFFIVVYGTIQALRNTPDEVGAVFVLFCFLLVTTYWGFQEFRKTQRQTQSRRGGWLFLCGGITILIAEKLYLLPNGANTLGLVCIAAALLLRFAGKEALASLWLPIVSAGILLPCQSDILLSLSFPLRLISSAATVGILQICGLDVTRELTVISINQREVAITDACSGISEIWTLLLFTAIFLHPLHIPRIWKTMGLLLVFPIVITANILRLCLTFLLFFMIGDTVFDNRIHIALGYFFLLVSFLLLWGIVRLIRKGLEE